MSAVLEQPQVVQAAGLIFEPAMHLYQVRGVTLPSVTQILKPLSNFDGIPPSVLERKRQIGEAVHAALDMHDRGIEVDQDSIDPAIIGYVQAYLSFLADHRWTVIASEWRGHQPMGYAGTIDRIFLLPNGARSLTDLKCTADISPVVGPQTAGYKRIWNHWNPGLMTTKRHALQLKPDGKYRLSECTGSDDWEVFAAQLKTLQWRKSHGI